jgi:UDP-N-acetylmuramoyl-L-alanyl-D-glutamate--2,6-diaminopimelate ligase
MTALRDLLPDDHLPASAGLCAVAGIASDSRAVKKGDLFFAVSGVRADGLSFAPAAVAAGACAVVAERAPDTELGVPVIVVSDVRAALSKAASRFYPRQPQVIVAVTGTSGKTSVASFVRQIWIATGQRAAALGTTGLITPEGSTSGSLTTPDPITLHALLDEIAGDGVTHLAMEASSHGLDQRRLDGVHLSAAAFTNLSRDHLDYHPDLDSYLAAKLRLFDTLLRPGQVAVIDADAQIAPQVIAACKAAHLRLFTIGARGNEIKLVSLKAGPASAAISIIHAGETYDITIPLAGDFMVSNALVAAGLCIATGSQPRAVFAALSQLKGAPGRLEKAGEYRAAPIYVDYAHKPDALEKVLQALRPLASRRLFVVFGCGGDRDAGKRAIMGAIAARLADCVIITDDNPRSEDPAAIRAAILAAAPGALNIADRGQAIAHAIGMLEAGDVLVIAGKGHETGQILRDRVIPFSDHEAVRAALQDVSQ